MDEDHVEVTYLNPSLLIKRSERRPVLVGSHHVEEFVTAIDEVNDD